MIGGEPMFWKSKVKLLNSTEVIEEEKKFIKESKSTKKGGDIWGLGISGGGIRSASVGLGVMQALVASPGKSILSKMDYLSTVSGGGYIGTALTWFLHKGLPDGKKAGTDPDNFPLGQIGTGARSKQKGNLILNFIRQHGNYLLPGQGLNVLSLFGVTIRSMFISLLVYLSLLTTAMGALKYLNLFKKYTFGKHLGIDIPSFPGLVWLAIAVVIILIVLSLLFSIRTYLTMGSERRYKNQIIGQKFLGKAWKWIFVLGLLGSLVYFTQYLPEIWQKAVAGTSLSVGTILGLFQHKKAVNESGSNSGGLPTLAIYFAAFLLNYGLLFTAYLLSGFFPNWFYIAILAVVTMVLGIFVNLNYVGLHRMYRNRLMETFLPNVKSVENNKWQAATDANDTLLENICDKSRRPYHLINTNIVLVDSPTTKYRGRGGDSFLFSKLYTGSDATGYIPTKNYMKQGRGGITLSTAMAISGAAVNPNTGSAGRGPTRNKMVSALLGILNLRLGYWAKNPRSKLKWSPPPNFIKPGLNGDVLGGNLNENKADIQLTDGGHFENLALYELIRRKAKVIIISDAGADVNYRFSNLANAIEKVRVDFGVTIRFDKKKYGLNMLLPGSSSGYKLATNKYQLAERGFAIADINYHDKKKTKGKLIYLKSTLIKDLPADIYGYKSANPTFPNQTTANQFFNEEQFEAYRELGYQLTWQMLKSDNCKKILGIKI